MAEIILHNGTICIVDQEDYDRLNTNKYYDEGRYVCRFDKGKKIYLHREILRFPDCDIDHINGNKRDNRKQNLRTATRSENLRNKGLIKANRTGVRGCYWDKQLKKYRVRITVGYKDKHIGLYSSITDAKRARLKAEVDYFGEFRHIDML